MKTFVPNSFIPPFKTELSNKYIVQAFKERDNPKDYTAVMENAKLIDKLRGGKLCHENWPSPDFTSETNLKDVRSFINDFRSKESFAFIIWDKNMEQYLGCIYIYPITFKYSELKDIYDVDFSMWVTQDAYDQGKFPEIYQLVYKWLLSDWPFKKERIFHRNQEIPIDLSR